LPSVPSVGSQRDMSHLRSTTARMSGEVATALLVVFAAAAWWFTSMMSGDMRADQMMTPMSLAPFLLAWSLMMAAMMLPAVTPVVRLYQRAAAAGRVAPSGFFVLGYLVVWALTGLPAYVLWRMLAMPLSEGVTWALRLAGVTLLFAGAYQLTPLKRACLRHCRSPMSYFMRLEGSLEHPGGAFRAGLLHARYCCGCCAALMAVLVVTAAMNLWWAVLIGLGVFVERNVRWGVQWATGWGVLLLALGTLVVARPSVLYHLI
jgi:predicted metal-binding membrane protein